uniref:Uncharacterized protein n=1 Tax=Salix viminalis TaxID=40686 RepID=A0A6N2MYG6_SALVM
MEAVDWPETDYTGNGDCPLYRMELKAAGLCRRSKPRHQQESALITTSIHHPKVHPAIAMSISKYIICRSQHCATSSFWLNS